MKTFTVVLEEHISGIRFAMVHCIPYEERFDWRVIETKTFALKGKASHHAKQMRAKYTPDNLRINPDYEEPRSSAHYKLQRGAEGTQTS